MTKDLRILITNDDGIHADGLEAMEAIATELSDDVWVVAPETEQSGASHSLTLHLPLRLRKIDERRYAVAGTPTDCVMMAVKHIIPRLADGKGFDLMFSGVNRGSNIAEDVTYSGTVAGAMEGTLLGLRSIAFSQAYGFGGGEEFKWATAITHGPSIVKKLLEHDWPAHVLYNVNFPDIAADQVERVEVTRQGKRDQSNSRVDPRVDARGNDYYWLGYNSKMSNPPEGTDLKAIYSHRISVTPLHLNLTEIETLNALSQKLNGLPPRRSSQD